MESIDCDKKYRALAHQFFGDLEASKLLPYINVSDDQSEANKRELKDRVPLLSKQGGPLHLGRCLVCYSFIDRSDRLHFLGGSVDNLEKRTSDVAEFIKEFLDVLATCVHNLEKGRSGQFSHRTSFDNSIRRMAAKPWVLCRTCQVAARQLVKSYNEFKSLQAKFMSAIKLSLAMRTREVVATTGEEWDKPQQNSKITVRMVYTRTVRKVLMGGKIWWRKAIAPLAPYLGDPPPPSPSEKNKTDEETLKSASVKVEVTPREENQAGDYLGDDFLMDDHFSDIQGSEETVESVGIEVPAESSKSEAMFPSTGDLLTGNQDNPKSAAEPQESTSFQGDLKQEVVPPNETEALKIMKTEGVAKPKPVGKKRPYSRRQPKVPRKSRRVAKAESQATTSLSSATFNSEVVPSGNLEDSKTVKSEEVAEAEAKPNPPVPAKRAIGANRRPISELKDTSHKRFRETIGQTMTEPEYRKMRREFLIEKQKIDPTTGYPSRTAEGVKYGVSCWKTVNGKEHYRGVEIPLSPEGQYMCPHCTKFPPSFQKKAVAIHIKHFHVDTSNGHPCDFCDQKFYSVSQLKEHKIMKHLGGYQCDICGIQLANRGSFYAHKHVKHEGKKPHVCDHCGRGFATRKDLTIHIRRHTGERPFVCHVCADAFIDKQALKQHMRKRHPEVPLEEGQAWNYVPRVTGPKILKDEVKRRYEPETVAKLTKPHVCDLCGKTLTSKKRLDAHQLAKHKQQRQVNFECLFCSKVYAGKHGVARHMSERHPEVPWVKEKGRRKRKAATEPDSESADEAEIT